MVTGNDLASVCESTMQQRSLLKTLRKAEIAVTEIRCDDPLPGMSTSIQREDAFLVELELQDFPHREYWEDGRQTPLCDYARATRVRPAARQTRFPHPICRLSSSIFGIR
jgi:hypothetical protein